MGSRGTAIGASSKSAIRNKSAIDNPQCDGWHGWDAYAAFYDWENARTLGRRDVPFWQRLARATQGRLLELGCGTGRVLAPVARATRAHVVGIDRSVEMLRRARARLRRTSLATRVDLVRGDIRHLPFHASRPFDLVLAPYGVLQSLTREGDLGDALASIARALRPGGLFVLDLVPDVPRWREYERRVSLTGRRGREARVTLIETVRQDRRRGLTIFDQEYVERRGGRRDTRRFSLVFRTLSVPRLRRRLERAGFRTSAVLGDYQGGRWDPRADVWVVIAERTSC